MSAHTVSAPQRSRKYRPVVAQPLLFARQLRGRYQRQFEAIQAKAQQEEARAQRVAEVAEAERAALTPTGAADPEQCTLADLLEYDRAEALEEVHDLARLLCACADSELLRRLLDRMATRAALVNTIADRVARAASRGGG